MFVLPASQDELYKKSHPQKINEDDLFSFLKSRQGKLDGVVITGGEPTLHADLPEFIRKIKNLGYKVKLDTNGTNPERLELMVNGQWLMVNENKALIDYVAMDLKAPLEKYEQVVGVKVDLDKIRESIKIIMNSGLPYEFRTTVVPTLLDKNDIEKMGQIISGADKWYLQKFKSNVNLVDERFRNQAAYNNKEMGEMVEIGKEYVQFCDFR
jgi:pyruvate formate lyase activating enzyme